MQDLQNFYNWKMNAINDFKQDIKKNLMVDDSEIITLIQEAKKSEKERKFT